MTPLKEKGTKFEIWLELLLNAKGYQNVFRNIQYHKEQYTFRQLDLQYNLVKNGKIYTIGIEAKYSSNGPIPFKFRSSKEQKNGQLITINNLIDEVLERKMFCGLDNMILVTNNKFSYDIIKKSNKVRINLIDGNTLTEIFQDLGYGTSINKSIQSINVSKYNLLPNRIYI